MKQEIYISIDIESDGPIPGPHSMLSLGAVAFDSLGVELGSWYSNFHELEGAQGHEDTMRFWQEHDPFYQMTRQSCVSPQEGMKSFSEWVMSLPGKPVAVAAPAGFDFTWVYWYLMRFTGTSPFSFSCIDMKTMVMTMLKLPYRESTKRAWRKSWQSGLPHTHHALSDAREQGVSFCLMLKELHST